MEDYGSDSNNSEDPFKNNHNEVFKDNQIKNNNHHQGGDRASQSISGTYGNLNTSQLEDLDDSYGSESGEDENVANNGNDEDIVESLMFESNGFDMNNLDEAIEERKKKVLNRHLTKIENEIYQAIRYGDSNKLADLGGGEAVDLNFKIEVEKDQFYYPVMLAAALGEADCLKVIVKNT